MRIAVIGAGVSGLVAAHRLCRHHDVTVFEADVRLGGHVNTVDVQIDGERRAIDTGFIVFNDWTYPRFTRLLNELGVKSRATSMSFSVHSRQTGLEYNGSSLNGLFARRTNLLRPGFWRMLGDIARFNGQATKLASDNSLIPEMTVGEFLDRHGYSREFANHYLLPMGSAIWSCPTGAFRQFPIGFIVEFYRNHGLLNLRKRPTWRVIEGGSRTYVEALMKRFRGRVWLGARIERVRRLLDRVEVKPSEASVQDFDHVVFACHSDQALKILADPSMVERDLLSAFPYERNQAVLHTDVTLLPRRRRAWASWNYCLTEDVLRPASVTYCMNILQQFQSRHVFNVTLNDAERINPSKVLGRFEYEHPVFTSTRAAAQSRHHELINVNRTSYCGAYWRNGFHEDGVVSAMTVCDSIQVPGSSDLSQQLDPFGCSTPRLSSSVLA